MLGSIWVVQVKLLEEANLINFKFQRKLELILHYSITSHRTIVYGWCGTSLKFKCFFKKHGMCHI